MKARRLARLDAPARDVVAASFPTPFLADVSLILDGIELGSAKQRLRFELPLPASTEA